MSQVLEDDHEWNDEINVYGSSNGETISELISKLKSEQSATIYIYKLDGTDRQDDAGIFEIAVVATFSQPTNTEARYEAFFWRALELWPEAGYAHPREVPADPLSASTIGLANAWFSECKESHLLECQSRTAYPMPKRVIDIGPSDGSVRPCLRMTHGRHGEWATLSHCWGNSVTTRLTQDTQTEMEMYGIDVANLTQNFQDAIVITKLLGLRYIWIDSLCIIQDSVEDWLEESAKMADIYKNSTITIAATNAENSTTGFLRQRRSAIKCSLERKDGVRVPLIIRLRIAWYGFAEITGPLTHRAWVLQERLLSPRILHFGSQQIMWQCRTKSLAEGFCDTDNPPVEDVPGAVESTLRKELLGDPSHDTPTTSNALKNIEAPVPEILYPLPSSIYGQWYHIIQVYAHLRLTHSADKLPAIARIAQQVHLRTGDTYLAGLWKSDIKRGLSWVYLPPSAMTRPFTPRAPSWSWAALDIPTDTSSAPDPAEYGFETALSLVNIPYEYEVTLEGFSPSLTEHGCLGSSKGSLYLRGLYCSVTQATDSGASLGRFTRSYPTPLSLSGQQGVGAAGRLDVHETLSDSHEIGCLQIGKMEHRSPGYKAGEFVTALLLQSVDRPSSRFMRIGLAMLLPNADSCNNDDWKKQTCEIV